MRIPLVMNLCATEHGSLLNMDATARYEDDVEVAPDMALCPLERDLPKLYLSPLRLNTGSLCPLLYMDSDSATTVSLS